MQPYLRTRQQQEGRSRTTGLLVTAAIHVAAAVFCVCTGLKYLDPPPPERTPDWLGRLLDRFSPERLETEDLMLLGLFYLLYRETGDTEFLFLMAGIVFF
ncbi:MAG: hypothetical protein IJ705_02165 [Oscillospiraceae bacterium]|nr:hypothetical protein [Oscillospiraceae bacterium]